MSFQVTAAGSFNQSVTVSCTLAVSNAVCNLTPGATVNPTSTNPVNMTATVTVPPATAAGSYPVAIQASTTGSSTTLTTLFTLKVTTNPDFVMTEPSAFPEVNAGSTGTTGPISITAQDGFSGTVTLSCPTTYGAGSCSISPTSVSTYPASATLTINGSSFAGGTYSLSITGVSGSVTHTVAVPFNVGDYSISGTQTLSLPPGGQGTANLTLTSSTFYAGNINASCDATSLSGAMCTLSPVNPITVTSGGSAHLTATINVPNNAAPGAYNINISAQDTTGAPSHNFTVALTVGQDFLVTSSTTSQTVHAGQTTGPYNLTVQPVGASFDAAVTLACSGLPALTQCLLNPSTPVTPGNSAVNVILTISTTATTTAWQRHAVGRYMFYAAWLLLPGIVIVWGTLDRGSGKRSLRILVSIFILVLLMLTQSACGGVSTGGGGGVGGHQGTLPGTYQITVTGSSPGTAPDAGQSTQVTLIVN